MPNRARAVDKNLQLGEDFFAVARTPGVLAMAASPSLTFPRSEHCGRGTASRVPGESVRFHGLFRRLFWRDAESPSRTGVARETRALPGSEAGATRDFVRAASTINLYSFQ